MDFYYKKFSLIVAVTAGSILIAFIRGGKDLKSIIGSKECSRADWIAFGVYTAFMVGCIALCFMVVYREQKLKKLSKFPHHPDEHLFTKKFLWGVNIIGLVIGFVSTNIGIGGGAIMTPVLLKLNFMPQVISYTSMYLIVWNRIVSAIVFFAGGYVVVDYLLLIGGVMFVAILLSEFKANQMVKKAGRQSFITFTFVLLVMLSLLAVLYTTYTFIQDKREKNEKLLDFKPFCAESK